MLAVGIVRLMVLFNMPNISILALVVICSFIFLICSHSFIFLISIMILLVVRKVALLTEVEDGLLLFDKFIVLPDMVLRAFQELFMGRGAIGTITAIVGLG